MPVQVAKYQENQIQIGPPVPEKIFEPLKETCQTSLPILSRGQCTIKRI